MKSEKAMSHKAVIFFVLIFLIIGAIGVKVVINLNSDRIVNNLTTDMLLVQGKIKVIASEHEMDEEKYTLIGEKVADKLDDERVKKLIDNKVINKDEEKFDNYYIIGVDLLTDVDLHKDLDISYYVVNYDSGEVINPQGIEIDGKKVYTLSEIIKINEKKNEKKDKNATNEVANVQVNEEAKTEE